MKKFFIFLSIMLVTFSFCFSSKDSHGSREDYKIIKKAILKENQFNKEVKWLKILVIDNSTKKENVRITLPISLIELVINSCPESRITVDDECEIDFKKLFKELKKLGPTSLIEIYDEEEIVKIWLE